MISSERMIRRWAEMIVKLKVHEKDYSPGRIRPEENCATMFIRECKKVNHKLKVIGITESFPLKNYEKYDKLQIDRKICNRFIAKDGVITGYKINIKDGKDKLAAAKKALGRNNKDIGIIIESYEDIMLTELQGVRFTLYRKRLGTFVDSDDKAVF